MDKGNYNLVQGKKYTLNGEEKIQWIRVGKFLNKSDKVLVTSYALRDEYLKNIDNHMITLPKIIDPNSHVWHLFVIRTRNRLKLQKYLLSNGVETLIHYPIPPHRQDALKSNFNITRFRFV